MPLTSFANLKQKPTAAERRAFADWLKTRPKKIQKLAATFDPFTRWRVVTTGQVGYVYGYNDNGTMTMRLPVELNPIHMMSFDVFGFRPRDLVKATDVYTKKRMEMFQ